MYAWTLQVRMKIKKIKGKLFLFVIRFRMHGDVAIIVLERTSQVQVSQYRRRGSVMDGNETGRQTFFLELKIVSTKKSKFNQLEWKHYSVSF